jgi:hypothetical protein
MIIASSQLQDVLKQSTTVKTGVGCLVEYNMNLLTNLDADNITGPSYAVVNGKEAYKKIFPLDTIIKSNRPPFAGVRYAIFGDIVSTDYRDPRTTTYPINYRMYYPGLDTIYKYWVSNVGAGGTIAITYPKTIIANKIVVKFEISHAVPPTWDVYGTPVGGSEGLLTSGTSSDIPSFSSPTTAGVLTLYYTGSAWTTNASLHNVSSYVSLTSIKLTFGGVASKYIGVIEFSPRWVKDISDYVVNLNIDKESSSDSSDIIPVGQITANSLTMQLNNYNTSAMQILAYETADAFAFDPAKTYLYKHIELKPFFKIYHSNGALGTSPNKYDNVYQGTFYIDSFKINQYNDVNLVALDGAKILQETLCPPVLCENYSVTAIIRRLLDNIGFTNYNFNLTATDKSIISPNYWWADDTKTVWQAIQEVCRDTQMTALFDENNILQFYSREYMYTARTVDWEFTSATDGTTLANVISLEKNELPSANQVKILWKSAVTSNYEQNADVLWKSDTTFLGAAALTADMDSTNVVDGTPIVYISLKPLVTTEYENVQSLYSFNGYLAIEEEIVEYDGIEYEYIDLSNNKQIQLMTTSSDIAKYRGLALPGGENFKPSGKYKIKNRGAFGTIPAPHRAGTDAQTSSWSINNVWFT